MRTIIYIDGFNLYFRMLKDEPALKWLNLKALCASVLSARNQIVCVKYYTARVSGRLDPDAPRRQKQYLDALATVPEIQLHFGNFLITDKWAGVIHPPRTQPPMVFTPPYPQVIKVWKTEEKGSDVNLGCHLVRDAFTNAFDVAAVLSNDTDLVEPIRIVEQECNKRIGLITPVAKPASSLKNVVSFVRHVRHPDLQNSQFPDAIPGTTIQKPATWV